MFYYKYFIRLYMFKHELNLPLILASFCILGGRQLRGMTFNRLQEEGESIIFSSYICLTRQGCKETREKQTNKPKSSLSPRSKLVGRAKCTDPNCHVHSVEERVPPRGAQQHLCDPLHRQDLEKPVIQLSVMDKTEITEEKEEVLTVNVHFWGGLRNLKFVWPCLYCLFFCTV